MRNVASKKMIGAVLVFCMVFSMFAGLTGSTVFAETASFTAAYTNAALDSDWSGTRSAYKSQDNWAFVWSNWGVANAYMVYDKTQWKDDFTFSMRMNNQGSTAGKSTSMYFCFQDANNYYAVRLYNTVKNEASEDVTNVQFVKKVGGTEQVIASTSHQMRIGQPTVTLTHTAAGGVTVTTKENGQTTTVVDNVVDTTFPQGKIGFGHDGDGARFDGITVSGTKYDVPVPSPGAPKPVTYTADNFIGVSSGLPTGWTGTGFTIEMPATWGALKGSGASSAIYQTYIWEGPIDYTWKQYNLYGGTGLLYFYYVDSNNYYALEMKSTGNRLVKKVNGVETQLNQTIEPTNLSGGDIAIRVVRDANGVITVYKGTKGATPTTVLFTSDVADSANPKGKIGVAYSGSGGHMQGITVIGTAGEGQPVETTTPSPSPTVAPSPSPVGPQPTAIAWEAQFVPNFMRINGTPAQAPDYQIPPMPQWAGNGFTLGTWNDYKLSATEGKLIADQYTFYNTLDYSISQTSLNNAATTGYLYFMYQDENNYYAVEMKQTGTTLLKKVNGQQQVIGTSSLHFFAGQPAVRVQREQNGRITVWKCKKDNPSVATDLLIDQIDTSLNWGKAGIGYAGRPTASYEYFAGINIKGNTSENPVKITLTPGVALGQVANTIGFDPLDPSAIRPLGRAYAEYDSLRMAFPLAGMEFEVSGATEVYVKIKATFDSSTTRGTIGVFIDDSSTYERISLSKEDFGTEQFLKVASFDEPGDHKIRIIKLSAWSSTFAVSQVRATGEDVTIVASEPKARKIEIVGDSQTAGGSQYAPGAFNSAFGGEAWFGYPGQTAAYFDADISLSAVGGGGLLVNPAWANNSYKYYDYQDNPDRGGKPWNFEQFRPDIVVVNLGTNGDVNNPSRKHTKEDFIAFYQHIREKYNDTNNEICILFALGAMNNHLENAYLATEAAVAEINKTDQNVYFTTIGDRMQNGSGAHPDYIEHQTMAKLLTAKIEEVMGWEGGPVEPVETEISIQDCDWDANGVTVAFRAQQTVSRKTTNAVVAALYDAQTGMLIGATIQDVSFTATTPVVNDTVRLSAAGISEEDCFVRLFLWNNENEMRPLAKAARNK